MTYELWVLVWAAMLGIVHIVAAASAPAGKAGFLPWALGPRDDPFDGGVLAGRLQRAQRNFLETFGFFAVLVIALAFAGKSDAVSMWGAKFYLVGRIVYLPLYALGVKAVRTLSFVLSLAGIFMCFYTLING